MSGTRLLQKFKPTLLEVLSEDPDFLLQRCHSLGLLSQRQYNDVKDEPRRSSQACHMLDAVLRGGGARAGHFLELLRSPDVQQNFPKLEFLLKPQKRKISSPDGAASVCSSEPRAKRRGRVAELRPLSEKQMMKVARCIGSGWKEVGIMALDMNTATLQQIEEDNKLHTERVFTMLRRWSMREREKATATRLYQLLSREENVCDLRSIRVLLS